MPVRDHWRVLEAASGDDLHDIRFMHHRLSSVVGNTEVRVLRMGMAGTLAYELHGRVEDARPVYRAIFEAGEPFGIRRLGHRAYMMNHTENGFPQAYYHFPYPWREDKDFAEYVTKIGGAIGFNSALAGSMGPDIRLRYRNPVELGWTGMINSTMTLWVARRSKRRWRSARHSGGCCLYGHRRR